MALFTALMLWPLSNGKRVRNEPFTRNGQVTNILRETASGSSLYLQIRWTDSLSTKLLMVP